MHCMNVCIVNVVSNLMHRIGPLIGQAIYCTAKRRNICLATCPCYTRAGHIYLTNVTNHKKKVHTPITPNKL